MLKFLARRILLMVPTLIAISIISFVIIQLPPGDFITSYVSALQQQGQMLNEADVAALKVRYGLDQPMYVQYAKWTWGVLRGDLGRSLQWSKPTVALIAERLPWTLLISVTSLVLVYLLGIPIGATSATHQYSVRDYVFTVIGFIGVAIPNFLFALILLWIYFVTTGNAQIGLFSKEYIMAPWTLARLWDLIKHLWLPALIVGMSGTAGLIRVMRANLLDELQKPYVAVARAKGLSSRKVLYKYPFRIAINPVVSTIGWTLPALVNGELLTSLVLGTPTLAPIFFESLMNQDMFLAGSIVMILSTLTVIGTLLSDLLLAWADPRIRQAV